MPSAESTNDNGTRAIVIATPVAHGHVRPLIALARRFAERGYTVVWAISGDDNEPASAWRKAVTDVGARFVDLDEHVKFSRGTTAEFVAPLLVSVVRRITARANDVAPTAADAIRAELGDRTIVGGVFDYFALWGYATFKRLGVQNLTAVISGFPDAAEIPGFSALGDDEVVKRERAALRAAGFGVFDDMRNGILPADPALKNICFSSPRLATATPSWLEVVGVQRDALPRAVDVASAPEPHRALADRLRKARESGAPVVLLSMGTVVTRMFARMGAGHIAFLKRLYTTMAASALRAGAFVIASTTDLSPADLGVDEATLGPAARDRVVAMPFVPQPFLLAQGLVDLMLMHGGANTFHEVVSAGVPVLVSPGFGDQPFVARASAKLGLGACVESISEPNLEGAISLDRAADEMLPAMMARGENRWKEAAARIAAELANEDGVDAAEAIVLRR